MHRLKVGAVMGKVLERASGVEEVAIGVEWLLHVHKSY